MESFDIEASKADLAFSKQQYSELLEIYRHLKSVSHPKQIFPEVERRLYNLEKKINEHETLLKNHAELHSALKLLETQDEELNDSVRRVRARFE